MPSLSVEASAPSNIALIKYMGKLEGSHQQPTNSSLSWTLDEMRTFVRITAREDLTQDEWAPLQSENANRVLDPVHLSEASIKRFLQHFNFLKKEWSIEKSFLIESANNFPADCGLASSASSFAALTQAAVDIFQELSPRPDIGLAEIADLSRRGSGSSCRSFFGPWALWHAQGVRPLEFPMPNLLHQVVVVTDKKKTVSSSEAHRRVPSSYLFTGRKERAERRLAELTHALQKQNWQQFHDLAWAEFWDMHSLFETSRPAFGYLEPSTMQVLDDVKSLWQQLGDGPVVTMDAGANVHLLWRKDQLELAVSRTRELSKQYRIISSALIEQALHS